MTREENLHWLNKEIETWENECQSKHPIKEALYAARKALEQEPNWIKCSEHLPKFDVDVLATTKKYGDVVKVTRWRTILKDCGWEWVLVDDTEGKAYNSDEIIAWMPLPKPYQGGQEDA